LEPGSSEELADVRVAPMEPLTCGEKLRYIPVCNGATPMIPMKGAIGTRASRPVSTPVKDANPLFWPRSKEKAAWR
jgi:hypothetical protein